MVLTGAKSALFCPECQSTQLSKVLNMAPGFTKITWAECLVCALQWDPSIPISMQRNVDFDMDDDEPSDQGKDTDHDPDHTRGGQDPE